MYKWDPGQYEKSSSQQYRWAEELIAKLRLEGNERVLDIGCGDGKVTVLLAAELPDGSVVGIDNSPDMVEHARSKHKSLGAGHVSFQVGDARNLGFHEEFDVVFSNAALHWVIDHGTVLSSIYSALKPGGRVLLQMGGKDNAQDAVAVLEEMMEEEVWRSHFRGFDFPYGFHDSIDYRLWLEQAGFLPTRVELIEKDMEHRGEEGFAGWIRTTWLPYTQRVPEELREAFVEEMVRRYISRFPMDARGMVHIRMVRLEVEAVKPVGN